ncbi:hypothetical protein J1N35_023420 [Gossypium stocksii]|uniref:Uncharacterized protein n=1 Tax=Gossypium stocksii TaxID=47602 RepID=A0A9D3VK91_9ROSI|nr:hypothetical protein J1N35_023420 [Gossypium stocksii]
MDAGTASPGCCSPPSSALAFCPFFLFFLIPLPLPLFSPALPLPLPSVSPPAPLPPPFFSATDD